MRILLVCHGWPPESIGGVEQHVEGLSEALAAAGHQVHVFARSSAPGRPQGSLAHEQTGNVSLTRAAYRWEGLTGLDSIYECRPMAEAMRSFLEQERAAGRRFDVAHVHHLTGLSIDTLTVIQQAGVPTVLTLHDYWLMCPRGQMWHRDEQVCEQVEAERCGECLRGTFPDWIQPDTAAADAARLHDRARDVLSKAARLVVPSARAIAPFERLGIARDRFTVVANGVDTLALEGLPPPACGPGPLRLGYLGTLVPSKGLHVLIDAVLQQPPGSIELSIHGNVVPYHGDETFPLRCFGKLQPGAPVRYAGPYSTADLPTLLTRIDVLCAPALWHEAFGLTVREALAASRPVLVSRIGGLQDAITDGVEGRILPPGDVAAWAAAIAELAADRRRVRAMAAQARPRARGFRAMAEELASLYAELAPA
ncbi:MAG: glycosyltransferase family 4 protein [Planctomycetota bacterium]|nr:glycosyltransferase family 4 protein [Planctomycetota bacterium]